MTTTTKKPPDAGLGQSIADNMTALRTEGRVQQPSDPLAEEAALEGRRPKRKELARGADYGREGWLHPNFWIPLKGDDNWQARDTPSRSLDAFFHFAGRVSSVTAARAAIAQGLREAMADDARFDRELSGLIIGRMSAGPLQHWLTAAGEPDNYVDGEADLLVGDVVHVRNAPHYRDKHPGGAWDEATAIYAGQGQYETHGLGLSSLDEVRSALAAAYNAPPGARESEELRNSRLAEAEKPTIRGAQITPEEVTVDWSMTERATLTRQP